MINICVLAHSLCNMYLLTRLRIHLSLCTQDCKGVGKQHFKLVKTSLEGEKVREIDQIIPY